MAHIRKQTTLDDVRADKPRTIWYSVNTCWWTHRQVDLRQHPRIGLLPCDPRGGMLMMTEPGGAEHFLRDVEKNPKHYGKHGLDAFIAAHNDNCVVSETDAGNTCLQTWDEYNDLLDRQLAAQQE